MGIVVWAQEAVFIHICIIVIILDCLGQVMQVLYFGRAPRTRETLPDFLKWRRVTRHPLVFRGLTGGQWIPGVWGVTFVTSDFVLRYTHLMPRKTFKFRLSRNSTC